MGIVRANVLRGIAILREQGKDVSSGELETRRLKKRGLPAAGRSKGRTLRHSG
jgi:hypothetical protein